MAVAERTAAKTRRAGARLAGALPCGRRSPRGRERWYLVQVPEGRELSLCHELQRIVPRPALADAFVPQRERWMKRSGLWFTQVRVMYPGYVFIASPDAPALAKALAGLTLPARLVGTEDRSWVPVADEARVWLASVMDEARVIRSSQALLEGGELCVVAGPLMGQEARICEVNRHKRFCRVRVVDADGGFTETMPLDVMPAGGDAR